MSKEVSTEKVVKENNICFKKIGLRKHETRYRGNSTCTTSRKVRIVLQNMDDIIKSLIAYLIQNWYERPEDTELAFAF